MLSAILWLPIAVGIVGCLLPKRLVGWFALLGSIASLVLAVVLVTGFDGASGGLQESVSDSWIPDLGVRYELGVDGLSVFMILLTSLLWTASVAYSAIQGPDRARSYFFMLALGQMATLGADRAGEAAVALEAVEPWDVGQLRLDESADRGEEKLSAQRAGGGLEPP